jgi:cardiolipin synthase
MLNIPNALTLLRIVAIPAFLIVLTDGRHGLALVLLIAAGLTDAADGAIARLTHQKTTLGAYLDPLADKLLLVSTFITLAFLNQVPVWLTVLVISRDAVIVTGFFLLFVLTQRTMEIRPSAFGKAATFFQLFSVIAVLARLAGVATLGTRPLVPLFVATGVVTAVAGLQYMYRGLVWVQRPPPRLDDGRPGVDIQDRAGRGS